MQVTATMVKELRDRTEAGFMDCKNALVASDGDMDKAIDWLRKKGISKAIKKEGRVAAEGIAMIISEGNTALLVEMNSETDFAANNVHFVELVDAVSKAIFEQKPESVEAALEIKVDKGTLKDLITDATAIINEKLSLRRFQFVTKNDDEEFGLYTHMNKQVVAVSVVKPQDAQLAKNIAMQVASMAPTYVSEDQMPADLVEHEKEIQAALMKNDPSNANKPQAILDKMLSGKVSKSLKEMCLVDQEFIFDNSQKVGAYLKENKATVVKFARYHVGEGIEKKQENYAEEVSKVFG
jgi:elongation factor Ts